MKSSLPNPNICAFGVGGTSYTFAMGLKLRKLHSRELSGGTGLRRMGKREFSNLGLLAPSGRFRRSLFWPNAGLSAALRRWLPQPSRRSHMSGGDRFERLVQMAAKDRRLAGNSGLGDDGDASRCGIPNRLPASAPGLGASARRA